MICRCEINNKTSIFDNYSLILRILYESTLNLQASTVNIISFLQRGVFFKSLHQEASVFKTLILYF